MSEMSNSDSAVPFFRLAAVDIANGNGIATVYLRSGAVLKGRVDKAMSAHVLHLNTERGWTDIDYAEIAALNGETA